ncbi:hypothetical protein [uncultured Thiodictyon sp.]|uniref:hypothetical protein n=1 Tax=uncultured Thiodictyon sp. TaxID=1846217 RepID=UPI0025D8F5F6|nr:hypothetical protein [uncultured Thiodictyon sp.]
MRWGLALDMTPTSKPQLGPMLAPTWETWAPPKKTRARSCGTDTGRFRVRVLPGGIGVQGPPAASSTSVGRQPASPMAAARTAATAD